MRIAVDALGGDNAPREIVAGTVSAAGGLPQDEFVLVGKPETIEPEVGADPPANISLRSSGDAVGMDEEPSATLRANPDASVAVAARMVRDGEADALFSAGNTGATVAAALLRIGRLEGCRRPAIATMLPFPSPVMLLDAGATVSCRPHDLLNFAILGGVFAKRYFGLDGEARVGLVNVGEEPGKGNDLAKEAYRLMDESRRPLRRKRRGPGHRERRGRRARDGRLHGQRRPQDGRGRGARDPRHGPLRDDGRCHEQARRRHPASAAGRREGHG